MTLKKKTIYILLHWKVSCTYIFVRATHVIDWMKSFSLSHTTHCVTITQFLHPDGHLDSFEFRNIPSNAAMNILKYLSWGKCTHISLVLMLVVRSVWLFVTPWTVARQAPLSMEFSRQEYWRGLPFSSARDLLDPRTELGSPALQADSLPSKPGYLSKSENRGSHEYVQI